MFVYLDKRTGKRVHSRTPLKGKNYELVSYPTNTAMKANEVKMKNGLIRRYNGGVRSTGK